MQPLRGNPPMRPPTATRYLAHLAERPPIVGVNHQWSSLRCLLGEARALGRIAVQPAASTFHYILSSLPPDVLDRALGAWTRQRSDGAAPVALDGKACAAPRSGPPTGGG